MIKTLGLTHLALVVRDLERSVRFYEQVVGARIVFREEGRVDLNTPDSNDVITLHQEESDDVGVMGGVRHFGFRLASPDDIDAATQAIERSGGTVVERGEFVPGEPYVFARDPDGYVIEVWYELEENWQR